MPALDTDVISIGSMARVTFVLLSGASIAQLINFVGALAIARLFQPADFGLFAIFISIQAMCVVFATMRYELAMVVEHETEDVLLIAALSTWLIVGMSLGSSSIAIFLWLADGGGGLTLSEQLVPLLWLLPLSLFCSGQYVLATQWCIRLELFSSIALAGILVSVTTLCVQVVSGLCGGKALGLTVGFVMGQAIGMIIVWQPIIRRSLLSSSLKCVFDWSNLKRVAALHFRFPAFQVPNSFASVAYSYFPAIILGSVISPHAAGVFSMAFRLTFQPMALLPTAFGQVVFSRLSRSTDRLDSWEKPLGKIYLLIGLLLAGPAGIVMALGAPLTETVLGIEWIDAGRVMQILILPCLLMALSSGYDRIFDVVRQQFLAFLLSVISAAVLLLTVQFTAKATIEVSSAAIAFAVVHAAYSLAWTSFAFRSCCFSITAAIGRWVLIAAVTIFVGGLTVLLQRYIANPVLCSLVIGCAYVLIVWSILRRKLLGEHK